MKSELFKNELDTIVNDDIREFAKVLLDDAPDYFFEVPASSTGKYHPRVSIGERGLVRHTKAVIRFYNHIMSLEQNILMFTEREIDLGIIACLAHDIQKSGTEEYYLEKSKDGKKVYTVFDHPLLAAKYIMGYSGKYLTEDELRYIALSIGTHMGQWNTDKHSDKILPKPGNDMQKIVHLADYLASRKDIEVSFKDDEYAYPEKKIEDIVCPFKKHKDKLLIDVAKEDPEYLKWLLNNVELKDDMKRYINEAINMASQFN